MVKYDKVKTVLLVLAVIIGSVLLWNYAKSDNPAVQKITKTVRKEQQTPHIVPQKSEKRYLFVPYWSFGKTITTDSEYSLIYFGAGVNMNGIEANDKGYSNIAPFIKLTPNASERILAIRMVDKTINSAIIKNSLLEEKIASQAVELAIKNKFDGVLLDYETSAFGFESTTNNISSFYKLFAKKAHDSNLKFYVSLYGDTYFQSRPFDVKAIGVVADKVLIMAYDFSKSGGNPGPNFPFSGREKYGYDFAKMIDDFQKDVDNQKLIVILGYFGYDWRVDKNGNALSSGVPLSTIEITKEFIDKCGYKTCNLNREPVSYEPSIRYQDEGGAGHIVWFEDDKSIAKKKDFLKGKGILETAAWAYSYF